MANYEEELKYYTFMKEGKHVLVYNPQLSVTLIGGAIHEVRFKELVFRDAVKAMEVLSKMHFDAERDWLLFTVSENIRIMAIWHDIERRMPIKGGDA